jgi:hypothetical protein
METAVQNEGVMKELSNAKLAKFIETLPGSTGSFTPSATYDPDGDCIEFMFAPDDFYAERIDDILTVYYSRVTGELIGSLVKNISAIKQKHPCVYAISVEDGKVQLRHLLVAAAGVLDLDQSQLLIYRKLVKAAEESHAEAELCESSAS